jgi:hypothetical protein
VVGIRLFQKPGSFVAAAASSRPGDDGSTVGVAVVSAAAPVGSLVAIGRNDRPAVGAGRGDGVHR